VNTPDPASLRVLIVEDEPRYRNLLEREIAAMGHRPTAFECAEDALPALDDDPYDVAILDLNLPGMSGMAFFEQVRLRRPDLAVIINTAYGDMPTVIEALRMEAVDFLTKPCGLNEIEQALYKAAQVVGRRAESMSALPSTETEPPAPARDPASTEPEGPLADVEREHILAVLERHNWHKPSAAEELGISLRTLYNKIALYRREMK
jgi:DNA-binding NtrC family response regulator